MSKKFGIVILNYLNWRDTVECIDSLFQQSYQDFQIVIVDNCSKNESVLELDFLYHAEERITILKTNSNLGFAKGNNIGIKELKKMGVFKIFVINNDIILNEKDYLYELFHHEYSAEIGVIGTAIVNKSSINQNPIQAKVDLKLILKEMAIIFSKRIIFKSKFLLKISRKLLAKKIEHLNDESETINSLEVSKPYYLHGSAVFFTEHYLKKFDGFYPFTFLYFEEIILSLILKKSNLDFLYIPQLSIFHKEDQASILSFNNKEAKKLKFAQKSGFHAISVAFKSLNRIEKNINTTLSEKDYTEI
ncbi:glycosyltransferase family 2 protein [Enterococcus hulanensis]|uniref:Glycosyltransferase family 2 protein n=1 Tax=Enterococcus hulanensis TaxID=2559929 RepID=A0ABU3F592_9ENTE|nr:glycosyltransferase family 2 protein [Enterococcus hulanensis]MDT2602294.1 glycosyltransferase family 2 protein [Enterococcus hulanensis]MDT2611689.1 glycosyltransferase family 2 protein [Enterococcus hulanensis]MDT2618913.1 glycosyltransferase family 2 protein [Enterococcus hulanensis]MDT2630366.1 glycosyltransferase family 2 protein [Enterococcus hulanensis]MDT2657852.1 glycosyltransferase family 2 protein [Enterococcus hulanensis]